MLFVLLAADVRLATVAALGYGGIATVAALAVVVRPLGVFWSTRGSDLSMRERAFAAWLGPRGVVAAAVASVTATTLDGIGVQGGPELRALVFLTIATTVVVLGGFAPLIARLLRVRMPGREMVVILGAEELGLTLGGVLRDAGARVLFTDNNPNHCFSAEQRGFPVVFGDALTERTVARMRLERARAAIGMTPSTELNYLFALEAQEEYGVGEVYVATGRSRGEISARLAERHAARVLFDRPKDLERWNVRLRHGLASQIRLRFSAPAEGAAREPIASSPDAYLLLAIRHRDGWSPMYGGWVPQTGDEAIALIHADEEAAARDALERLGWEETTAELPAQVAARPA
jgi:voltage-gated potassium channel Kch